MTKSFPVIILCLLITNLAKADVKIPGVAVRQFMVNNIAQFPGYSFYYVYQSYHYDKGYQPNAPDTIAVEKDNRYSAASRGNTKTWLLAKDSSGKWIKSNIQMGGEAKTGPGIKTVVDVFTIVSITNGIIKLKKQKEIVQKDNGVENERMASAGFLASIGTDGFTGGMAIVSIAAVMGLLLIFVLRRKKRSYSIMTT